MNIQYFVNDKTRMCQMLGGWGPDHDQNVAEALKAGFREVTEEQQEAFRAVTKAAKDMGWKPEGRVSYEKFMRSHPGSPEPAA